MQPSSLVFVAIVAMWAAYLLPQWIRRRDTMGQARGRDRHSDRLRVLNPRRRSGGGPSTAPLLSKGRDDRSTVESTRPATDKPVTARPVADKPTTAPPVRTESLAARRRARVLLVLLTATSAAWASVPLGVLPGWVAVLPTVLLALDLVALRMVAVNAACRRRALSARRNDARPAQATAGAARRPAGARRPIRPAGSAAAARVAAQAAAARRRAAQAPAAGERGAAAMLTADGTWDPIPVPVPTYTLKPAVHRPQPPALAPSEGGPAHDATIDGSGLSWLDTAPGAAAEAAAQAAASGSGNEARAPRRPWEAEREWADDLDLDAVLARRRAVNG